MRAKKLVFLKLGGSLITDKTKPQTPRLDVLHRTADEIALAYQKNTQLQLVIGHGSGSFGHAIASEFQTQKGGMGSDYWYGFARVWASARELNQIVIQCLIQVGLPVIAFPPSSGIIAVNKVCENWDVSAMGAALSHGLIPVVQGDVVFDDVIGGTIFSTEQVFHYLTEAFHPDQILLAGLDNGVYQNPDKPKQVIPYISPLNITEVLPALSGAKTADVTGGMLAKVEIMLSLVQEFPSLQIQIFSGADPGNILKALSGETPGTMITQ